MRVSHETIYLSLFVQTRGALRRELQRCLRTGRAMRSPRGKRLPQGRGQLGDVVLISERPAEAEDRAVPGHWEGDLLLGKRPSAVVTLVERASRYVTLVALPGCRATTAVADLGPDCIGRRGRCSGEQPGVRPVPSTCPAMGPRPIQVQRSAADNQPQVILSVAWWRDLLDLLPPVCHKQRSSAVSSG
jgi:hypothetical protein